MEEEAESNICEITVMRNGEVCYEDYWNGFQSGDALNVMSVTKSVIALLTGIAMHMNHGGSSKEDQFDFLMNKNPRRHEWYTDPKNKGNWIYRK